MAFATDNHVYDVKSGGRVLVSGGWSITDNIPADEDLVTLFEDPTHDPMWEIVMTKGIIISFYQKSDGRIVAVPCENGAGDSTAYAQGVLELDAFRPFEKGDRNGCSFVTRGYVEWPLYSQAEAAVTEDATVQAIDGDPALTEIDVVATFGLTLAGVHSISAVYVDLADGADARATGDELATTLWSYNATTGIITFSPGIGDASFSAAVDWYAESFDNTNLRVGDYVRADAMGRPVKWETSDDANGELRIGQVKYVEFFGETGVVPATFDYGFLQYLQLPYEDFMNALIRKASEAENPSNRVSDDPLFGVRGNLDLEGVYGAVRVNLFGM